MLRSLALFLSAFVCILFATSSVPLSAQNKDKALAPAASPLPPISRPGKDTAPSVNYPDFPITSSDLLVGTQAESQMWTLTNSGDAAWVVSSVTTTGDFTADNQCTSLPPYVPNQIGAVPSCNIGIVFAPTSAGVRNGTLTITDNSVDSPHVVALTGNGLLTYDTPSITTVNGTAIDAQYPSIFLVGTNFYPASQILVNGSARVTHYLSQFMIYADPAPADLAQVGELPVSVSTPAPGGGLSNTAAWTIYSAVHSTSILHSVYDANSGFLYASVSTFSQNNPNQVLVIDPTTSTIVNSWSVGNGPDALALSDDSQFLYVGLDGDMKVAQLALPGGTVNFSVSLGTTSNGGIPLIASALRVLPGHPHSWVVGLCGTSGPIPEQCQLPFAAVYDDDVQRPTTAQAGELDSLVFVGNNANFVYGADYETSRGLYDQLSISASGITLAQSVQVTSSPATTGGGTLDTDGISLYDSNGNVINPTDLTFTTVFPGLAPYPGVKVDVPSSRIYFAGQPVFGLGLPYTAILNAFDLTSHQSTGTIPFSEGFSGHAEVFRWGSNGLGVTSPSGVFLFRSSLTSGTAVVTQFEVTGLTPSKVAAGSPDLALQIMGAAFASGDSVTACGTPLSPAVVSATEIDVTVPALLLTAPGNVRLIITSPARQSANLVLPIGPNGPIASVSSPALNFGSLAVGVTSQSQNVLLANNGVTPLVVSNIAITGDFSQLNTCTSVVPGSICTITIVFTPTAGGDRTGTLTITDNDPSGKQTVNLTGAGGDFQVTPGGGGAVATVPAGQSANYILTVTPASGFTGQVTFTCTNLPQYASCAINPPSANLSTAATNINVAIATSQAQTATVREVPGNDEFVPNAHAICAGLSWFVVLALLPFWPMRRALVHAGLRTKASAVRLVLSLAITSISIAGCGGGSSGSAPTPPSTPTSLNTPAGTYTVNVVATASGVTHTVPLTLVVQ
jgi:hypothetical protein